MRQQSFAASATFAFVVVAAGAIGVGSVPAQARTQNVQAEAATTNGLGTAEDKKQCRYVSRTGSNSRERICLTRDQWKRVDDYVAKSF